MGFHKIEKMQVKFILKFSSRHTVTYENITLLYTTQINPKLSHGLKSLTKVRRTPSQLLSIIKCDVINLRTSKPHDEIEGVIVRTCVHCYIAGTSESEDREVRSFTQVKTNLYYLTLVPNGSSG